MSFLYYHKQVGPLLPVDWQAQVDDVAFRFARRITVSGALDTSREAEDAGPVVTEVVTGDVVAREMPWVEVFYRTDGLQLMQKVAYNEPVMCESDVRSAMNINIQHGTVMRYEAHLDTCLAGILYVTDQPKGSGGELVVALNAEARGVAAIEAQCVRIYPEAGLFVHFDARRNPHYVTALTRPDALRLALVFAYNTPSCQRDPALAAYLYGQEGPGASP